MRAASPPDRSLRSAVIRDDATAIAQIVASGVDPNQPFQVLEGDTLITPLMFAVQRVRIQSSLAAVLALIRAGAQINPPTNDGLPLTFASYMNHRELILALLALGADVNATQKSFTVKHYTALHAASHYGHGDVVKLLIARGAYVNVSGMAPLHLAVQGGHLDVMRTLIACGADVNSRDDKGRTPLHYAFSQANAIELLVDEGADVSVRDSMGLLPAFPPVMEELIKKARRKRKIL